MAAIVAGIAGVLAACRWPYVFVLLTLWTSVLPTMYVFRVGSFGFAPYILVESCAIAGVAVHAFRRRSLSIPVGFGWFAAYVTLTSFSAMWSTTGWTVISMLIRYWFNWVVVLLVLAVVRDRARLWHLLCALAAQAFVVIGINLAGALDQLGLPSLPPLLVSQFQKNDYATYLSFAAVLGLIVRSHARRSGGRVTGSALLILAVAAWPLTVSRSGLLALATTMSIVFWQHRTPRLVRGGLLLAAAAILLWIFLPSTITERTIRAVQSIGGVRFSDDPDSFGASIDERLALNRAAFGTIRGAPVFGIGLGNWPMRSPITVAIWDPKVNETVEVGASIHNRYLLVAVESGLPTLVAYLGFLVTLIRATSRRRTYGDVLEKTVLGTLTASLVGLLVSMMFIPGSLWEWNLIAVLVAAESVAHSEHRARRSAAVQA